MLRLEEYIARRKKEDQIDEFDLDTRDENIRYCVNYVFEYFNHVVLTTEAEERTALKNEKLVKYEKQIQAYEPEVRSWLLHNYSEYGKKVHMIIGNILKQDELFFIYSLDREFRSLSYECYSKIIKKYPFLKEQTEMLFLFIKDYHRVESMAKGDPEAPFISPEITDWIQRTWKKHQVNVRAFAFQWVNHFEENHELWPKSHRVKSTYEFRPVDYDYKQKSNLFNLDSLYRKMPKKAFIKGRKQEFEMMMMYFWTVQFEGDEDYWNTYLEKTLPLLKEN